MYSGGGRGGGGHEGKLHPRTWHNKLASQRGNLVKSIQVWPQKEWGATILCTPLGEGGVKK